MENSEDLTRLPKSRLLLLGNGARVKEFQNHVCCFHFGSKGLGQRQSFQNHVSCFFFTLGDFRTSTWTMCTTPLKRCQFCCSLLYPCFKTALCYGVVSGCFVHGVSPSRRIRPEPAPEPGLEGSELACRTPESARKIHAKSFGP